ncbi:hypothetical protein EJ04DRAFT_549863 [Polyplosphaeria fusca]|uniref:Zn(2)-C6 fungal-type domain-containing protein n=1 Tax=Polyplosphaeria fusca TaxID=682080 RepID=A0A9P4R413_9PLEO|nr:hypothetical protein EJ04DRAFT_549863 [Polyplosphaeria fusca]
MLGYISSTRKKSCRGCVKAKRRCDLGYPSCAAARDAEDVVVRLCTPDLPTQPSVVPPPELSPPLPAKTFPTSTIDPAILQSPSTGSSSPESFQSFDSFQDVTQDELDTFRSWFVQQPRICESLLPQVWEPVVLSEAQILSSVERLCSFIPSLVYSGHTEFMHEAQYQTWQPTAFQDLCGISALYLVRTANNAAILRSSIDTKISKLIESSKTWTLANHLAAVQALIVYQIMRLFDPDLGMQDVAERQNRLLEIWTAHLWKRYFNDPQTFASSHDSWIFEESLRRTVLLSVFLRGAWSSITQGGLCDQVPLLARLPVARDAKLWNSDVMEWEIRESCTTPGEKLIAYGDMSNMWRPDRDVDQLTAWEKLLLAPCRKDDPRLLADFAKAEVVDS